MYIRQEELLQPRVERTDRVQRDVPAALPAHQDTAT